MITAKTKKSTKGNLEAAEKDSASQPPRAQKLPSHHNSTSESDSSSTLKNLDPETRNMLQIVVRIKKELLKKVKEYDPNGKNENIIFVLKGYVGQCGETSQMFIEKNEFQVAEKILRSCENLLKNRIQTDLVASTGLLYQVNNNLANLSNRTGDVPTSIKYLLAALDCTNDPRIQNKDDLPIAETLLNLANANTYLGNFEMGHRYSDQAYQFAAKIGDGLQAMIKGCEKKKQHLGESHPEILKMEDYYQNLIDQYHGQVNLKIMAKLATGQAFEKMEKYDNAIHEFRIGTQLVENNFGTQHHMYTVLANAMGGAKLKTKFQTKEVVHKKKSPLKEHNSKPKSPPKTTSASNKKQKIPRPSSANKLPQRRNIQKILAQSNIVDYHKKHLQDVRLSHKQGLKDNIFLTNCDTWAKVHCHKPRPSSKRESFKLDQKSGRRSSSRSKSSIRYNSALKLNGNTSMSTMISNNSEKKSQKKKKKHRVSRQQMTQIQDQSINSESLNIKITPKKAERELDTLSVSNNEEKPMRSSRKNIPQTNVIVRSSSCNSHGHGECPHHSQQNPFNNSYMQQLQMMRKVQEDQFKMMQLVMQSQQRNSNSPSQHCFMQNGFGNQMGYYPHYPQYPHQFPHPMQAPFPQYPLAYDPRLYPHMYGPQQDQESSYTETGTESEEVTESEQSYSERSKKRREPSTWGKRSQGIINIGGEHRVWGPSSDQKREKKRKQPKILRDNTEDSESLNDINDRESVQKSDYPLKMIEQQLSVSSPIKDSTLNARELFIKPSQDTLKRKASFKEIIQEPSQKHKVPDVNDSVKDSPNKKPILKNYYSEDPKNLTQDDVLNRSKKQNRARSGSRTPRSVSEKSNKSFRAEAPVMSKTDAAVMIQKNVKGFLAREDLKIGAFGKSSELKQKTLFKTSYKCKNGSRTIVTCKVNSKDNLAISLEFHVQDEEKKNSIFQIKLSLNVFGTIDLNGLKEKVQRILSKCEKQGSAQQDIQKAFQTKLAIEILKDESEKLDGDEKDFEESRTSPDKYEKNAQETTKDQDSKLISKDVAARRKQMEAEIRQIRNQMNSDAFVVNKIEVYDHKQRYTRDESSQSSSSSTGEFQLIKGGYTDGLQPITIEKIVVHKKFKTKKTGSRKKRDDSESSEHSYRVIMDKDDAPSPPEKEIILWKGDVHLQSQLFKVKLVKNDFLDYTVHASNPKTKSEMSKNYFHLPFEEQEAAAKFDENFTLEYKDGVVTDLILVETQKKVPEIHLGDDLKIRRPLSPNTSFESQSNVSRKVLYMYETKQHNNQYHVEITRQFSDEYKLFTHVIQVQDTQDRDRVSIYPLEKECIETQKDYVEQNLRINKKIDSQTDKMAFICINYPYSFLKNQKIDTQINQEAGETFRILRDGISYNIRVNQIFNKNIEVRCSNESKPKDECILIISRLDQIQGKIQDFLQQNLMVYRNNDMTISHLKLAGFTDGVDEDVLVVESDQGFWRKLAEEKIMLADTQIISSLSMNVATEEQAEDLNEKVEQKTTDTAWYKISLFHVNQNKEIDSLILTPSQSQKLFVDYKDLFQNQISIGISDLKIPQLQKGSIQLQQAIKKVKFESSQADWIKLLRCVIYKQSIKEVQISDMFLKEDIPKQSHESKIKIRNSFISKKENKVEIKTKNYALLNEEKSQKAQQKFNFSNERSQERHNAHLQALEAANEKAKSEARIELNKTRSAQSSDSEKNLERKSVKEKVIVKATKIKREQISTAQKAGNSLPVKPPQLQDKTSQNQAKEQIEKKIQAARLKAKADQEAKKNEKILTAEADQDLQIKQTRGTVKCNDAKDSVWVNFTLKCNTINKEVNLTVRNQLQKSETAMIAKNQKLSKQFISKVTGESSIRNGEEEETLMRLKENIEQRLRSFGAEYAKNPKDSLPEPFFAREITQSNYQKFQLKKPKAQTSKIAEDDSEEQNETSPSRKELAGQKAQAQIKAARIKAEIDSETKKDERITSEEEVDELKIKQSRGNVKCNDKKEILWVSFTIKFNPTTNEVFLTAGNKFQKGEAKLIAKQQKLSKQFITKVIGEKSIQIGEADEKLKLLNENIFKRFQAFGAEFAKNPKGSLPDSFFTKESDVIDHQNAKFSSTQTEKSKKVEDDDSADQNEISPSRKELAGQRAQAQIKAARIKAEIDEETKKDERISSEEESETNKVKQLRGNVKCNDAKETILVSFTLMYNPINKEISLTVINKFKKGETKMIAKNQKLSKQFITKVVSKSSIQQEEEEQLQLLKENIENRLRAFGAEYAKNPKGSLPDSFFTKDI